MSPQKSGTSDPVGDAIDHAVRCARGIKRAEQLGSYAWHVWSKRKRYRVQTDAEWCYIEDGLKFSFATCDCGGYYEDRTTICPHVIRVLQEIAEAEDDTDDGELPV